MGNRFDRACVNTFLVASHTRDSKIRRSRARHGASKTVAGRSVVRWRCRWRDSTTARWVFKQTAGWDVGWLAVAVTEDFPRVSLRSFHLFPPRLFFLVVATPTGVLPWWKWPCSVLRVLRAGAASHCRVATMGEGGLERSVNGKCLSATGTVRKQGRSLPTYDEQQGSPSPRHQQVQSQFCW